MHHSSTGMQLSIIQLWVPGFDASKCVQLAHWLSYQETLTYNSGCQACNHRTQLLVAKTESMVAIFSRRDYSNKILTWKVVATVDNKKPRIGCQFIKMVPRSILSSVDINVYGFENERISTITYGCIVQLCVHILFPLTDTQHENTSLPRQVNV